MGWNSATGYALHRIPAHRKKRTINLLQNRTFLFTSDTLRARDAQSAAALKAGGDPEHLSIIQKQRPP